MAQAKPKKKKAPTLKALLRREDAMDKRSGDKRGKKSVAEQKVEQQIRKRGGKP